MIWDDTTIPGVGIRGDVLGINLRKRRFAKAFGGTPADRTDWLAG
jgi:hypothetical protein